ncbi:MAG: bifunctional YncE family protein/alkaline phosphatase family protein [Acidobacteria bacterium]|nr:bifunctional YncE family protein/alkaline phosphatase family protein [Acidobacteriota bacterium]
MSFRRPAVAYLTFLIPALILFIVSFPGCKKRPARTLGLAAPAGVRPTEIVPGGTSVLPNGRLITPQGVQVKVEPHPYGMALSPDGKTLVTSNNGTWPFSVSIITELSSAHPKVEQIPPGYPPKGSETDPRSVYLGVAITPNNRTLYLSEGNNGKIGIFDLQTRRDLGTLNLDGRYQGKTYRYSLAGDLKLSPDGRYLYALDLAYFRMVVFDTHARRMIASVRVGRLPFGLALSPDGKTAYVSNVGMFRYSLVPGYNPKDPLHTGLDFPPFGFPSKQAEEGTVVQGKKIPGLGSPNVPQSNSVYLLDVRDPARPRVTARVRTGLPVGPKSIGGSSPGAVLAGQDKVYVSNSAQDSVSILDAQTGKVEKTLVLQPAPSVRGLRGLLPFGLALNPDGRRLYVACAGINALAVIDTRQEKVLGYIPTGWFPARVAVSPDGKTLYIDNAKGFGAGPNGGPNFHEGPAGDYIGDLMKGVVSIMPVPETSELGELTQQVLHNNGFIPQEEPVRAAEFPVPPSNHPSSKIRYVVFIVKENRTFDQVFGDLKSVDGERVNGDPALANFGDDATVSAKGEPTYEHVQVTPNEHALAERFGLSDNYYVDSDVSVDGHHWLVGSYPNTVFESAWPAAAHGNFKFLPEQSAPGRLEIGSTSPSPEDYLEAGSLWEHLASHGISFRNYGEDMELAGYSEQGGSEPTGVRESVNIPMPEVLFKNTSRTYPNFNTSIPDQYRFKQFKHEFDTRYLSGKEPLPQFIYIWLPNDHTGKLRPQAGYPYSASYVADNDLALGKMVQLFSHSPFWKHMAIFVTEDDAQSGQDHVDAHRSLLLVISPYSRPGVWQVHSSMLSILKTFDLIFGLPPMNQYDAAATSLAGCFTDHPDFRPYDPLPEDPRIFDPAKARDPDYYARHGRPLPPSAPLDDPAVIRREMDRQ